MQGEKGDAGGSLVTTGDKGDKGDVGVAWCQQAAKEIKATAGRAGR